MDFVTRLIQEGYCEEDIADILESIYLIEKNGGGNVLMEEAEYIVEVRGFLVKQLAKLRGLQKSPAIQNQIKRLQKLLGKQGDDVAKTTKVSSGKITGDLTKDTAKASQKAASKVDDVAGATKPKSKIDWKSNAVKTGLVGAGALTYASLGNGEGGSKSEPGSGADSSSGAGSDSSSSAGSDSSSSAGSDSSSSAETDKGKKDDESTKPFWHSTLKPKSLPYQVDPGLASYRNVRSHYELEGKVINESHGIILNYLISNGHADTVDEANYIMNQMELEHIVEILREENI